MEIMIPTACVSSRWEEEGSKKMKKRFEVEREAAVGEEEHRQKSADSIDRPYNPGNMPARFVVVVAEEGIHTARMKEFVIPVKVILHTL
jgi:hypothetical protein